MKNINLINKIIMIFLVLLMCFSVNIFAADASTGTQSGINIGGLIDDMNPTSGGGSTIDDPTQGSRLLGIVSLVFTVIQFVGTGISIIMVMWLGITYMITSVEPIVVGSVLIVSTVNILKFIQEVVTNSM